MPPAFKTIQTNLNTCKACVADVYRSFCKGNDITWWKEQRCFTRNCVTYFYLFVIFT